MDVICGCCEEIMDDNVTVLDAATYLPSHVYEIDGKDFTSGLRLEFAAHMMKSYLMSELLVSEIPIFDTVYLHYILWPAIYFNTPVLMLPHPRNLRERCLFPREKCPYFWKEYIKQVEKIVGEKPCTPVPPRVYMSRGLHVYETLLGFYYLKKTQCGGIYFQPKIELDPRVRATLNKTYKFDETRWETFKLKCNLPYVVTIEDGPPTNGTYNLGCRYDGKFERLCPRPTY